ncbi:MAG: hypothetical protein QXU93_08135 [Thermoproteus sp.]
MNKLTLDEWLQPGLSSPTPTIKTCREWNFIKYKFKETFWITPLEISCDRDNNGVVKFVIKGVYHSAKKGKATGRVVVYYNGRKFSWKTEWEREKRRKMEEEWRRHVREVYGLKDLPDFIYEIVEIADFEVLPNGNILILGREVPPEKLEGCRDVKCIKERIEDYYRELEEERKRNEFYKPFIERIREVFGVSFGVSDDGVKIAFKAVETMLAYSEFFGVDPKKFSDDAILMAFGAVVVNGVFMVHRAPDTYKVIWPFNYEVKLKERIHEEEVDGVKFKYRVLESPYGIVAVYDAE